MDNRNSNDRGSDAGEDLIATLIRDAGPREEPPADHRQEVWAATRRSWEAKVAGRRRRRAAYGLAAALAAVTLAIGLTLRLDTGEPGPVVVAATDAIIGDVSARRRDGAEWAALADAGTAIASGTRVRSGADGVAGLLLEDGSSLRLASASEILFESPGRVRLERGAVYVDTGVGQAGARRVEVVTPAGLVWDVGTQFEVRYSDDRLTVRIREGRVILERENGDIQGLAGEQLRLDDRGELERAAVSPFGPEWRWVQAVAPLPYSDNLTVHELLEWVARETGRTVHFAEPGLATRASRTILHGNPRRLLPMEALAVMLETTDLSYTVVGDGEILIAARVR